jgi:hypothetical protein
MPEKDLIEELNRLAARIGEEKLVYPDGPLAHLNTIQSAVVGLNDSIRVQTHIEEERPLDEEERG